MTGLIYRENVKRFHRDILIRRRRQREPKGRSFTRQRDNERYSKDLFNSGSKRPTKPCT